MRDYVGAFAGVAFLIVTLLYGDALKQHRAEIDDNRARIQRLEQRIQAIEHQQSRVTAEGAVP